MSGPVVDIFLVYQFLKRLTTPFDQTDAFRLGLIDANGKLLKSAKTAQEKQALGYFDRLIFNLKRLLALIPGGRSRIASFAAALLLLKEKDERLNKDEIYLSEQLQKIISNMDMKEYKSIMLDEDAPTNMTGSGVVGTGDNPVHWSRLQPKLGKHGDPLKKYGQPIDGLKFLRRNKLPKQNVFYKAIGKFVKPSKGSSSGGDEE